MFAPVLQIPVVGMEADQFLLLLITALAGGAFGALSGLTGELTPRIFYSHSGTHVDPPAMAIVLVMFLVGVPYLLGLLPNARYLGL